MPLRTSLLLFLMDPCRGFGRANPLSRASTSSKWPLVGHTPPEKSVLNESDLVVYKTQQHCASQLENTYTHLARLMAHDAGLGDAHAPAWRGTVRAVAAGPAPDAAWALLSDFCSLHRWVPSLSTCRLVEGVAGQPGCVRHCAGPVNMAVAASGEEEEAGWSRERLVGIDHAARWYSYEVVESNKGFGRYHATVRVEPDPAGCAVAWSFEADPVQGWTLDGFVGFLDKLARGVAKRLQEEIVVVRSQRVVSPSLY